MMSRYLIAALCFLPLPALAQDAAETFRAVGQEPGWVLTLQEGKLTLTRQDGAGVEEPLTEQGNLDDVILLKGSTLAATATPGLCHDTMSGMPYPQQVEVKLGEEVLTGCGGDPASLIAGDWSVQDAGGKPVEAPATLRFEADRIGGNSGCNTFFGSVALGGEGLQLSEIGATRMACPGPQMLTEMAVLNALSKVTRFDIAEDGALVLLGGDDPVLRATR